MDILLTMRGRHFAPENPVDGEQRHVIWISPGGCPHMPMQIGGGETAGTQHNPALGHRVMLMMT